MTLKELRNVLDQEFIKVKWNNLGTWQQEDYCTLLQYMEHAEIKIRNKTISDNPYFEFVLTVGSLTASYLAHRKLKADCIDAVTKLCAIQCLYLGDRTVIKTSRREWKL